MDPMYWDGLYAIITGCATSVVFWILLVLALSVLYGLTLLISVPSFGVLFIKNAEQSNEEPSARFWAAGYLSGILVLILGLPVGGWIVSTLASVVVFTFAVMYAYA